MNAFPSMNEMKSNNTKLQFINARNCYRYESRKLFKLYRINGQIVAIVKDDAIFNDLFLIQNIQLAADNGASYSYQLKDVVKVNGYVRFYFQ